jgi:hypothetical protein
VNKKLLTLLAEDEGIAALERLPSPVIVICGRAMKYKNPACIKEGYFDKDGRSCYTPYRIEIGKIKVGCGEVKFVEVPTVLGKHFALAYGRENDTVLFFTKQVDGIRDSMTHVPEAALIAFKFTLSYVLSGGNSIYDFCARLRERIGMFDETVSYAHTAMLIQQLVYRVMRQWLYALPEKLDDVTLYTEDLFKVLAEVTDSLKTCHVTTVETSLTSEGINVLCDGISCGILRYCSKNVSARVFYYSTKSGLIAATSIALAADLIYGGARSLNRIYS